MHAVLIVLHRLPAPPRSALDVTDRADLVALIEELVDAHLDTIEMGDGADHEWLEHRRYLQALVRVSQARLAKQGC